MYKSFYSFREKPFNTLPDPEFLFMSKKHEMALTYLEYGLTCQAGFMVLTGEVGSGKTTLINHLINTADESRARIALVFNTNVKPANFLTNALTEWGLSGECKRKSDQYEVLNEFLLREYSLNHNVILIIDEAQNLPFETLEEIRMVSNLNDEKVPLLHIILAGQPNLIKRLNDPKLEQLLQRVAVHYHLEPLNRNETCQYIKHRLQSGGSPDPDLFTEEALDGIYAHSNGVPRVINLICDTALVYGFAEQLKQLDRNVIERVAADRLKMGLGFGGRPAVPDRKGQGQSGNTHSSLEKNYQELQQHVHELARLVQKTVGLQETVETQKNDQQREIELLKQKMENLEKRLPPDPYPKRIQNFVKKWTQAIVYKEDAESGRE